MGLIIPIVLMVGHGVLFVFAATLLAVIVANWKTFMKRECDEA